MARPVPRQPTPDAVRVIFLLLAVMACGKERSGPIVEHVDQSRPKFAAAVDRFVAAGRTPAAFRELSQIAYGLAVDMDKSGRDEVERRLIVLALKPVESAQDLPIATQAETLALTVWPTLLADRIHARSTPDPVADAFVPIAGETVDGYLDRLCDGPMAVECRGRRAPKEAVIAAIAYGRAAARAKAAVAACSDCRSEFGWHEAVRSWEHINWAAERAVGSDARDRQ